MSLRDKLAVGRAVPQHNQAKSLALLAACFYVIRFRAHRRRDRFFCIVFWSRSASSKAMEI
jgi:hypothetical protein